MLIQSHDHRELHASGVEEEKAKNSMAQRQATRSLDASHLPQKQSNCSLEEKTPWCYRRLPDS